MSYSKDSLAYCSNVHPGADLTSVISNIEKHFIAVRQRRGLDKMASGLWLSEQVAKQLLAENHVLEGFKAKLQSTGVYLTSLNGFPFGDFHQAVVKQKVYLPTWAEAQRLVYSQNLASILAYCLPKNESLGAISTLPLAYSKGWTDVQHQAAIEQLINLVEYLAELEGSTGKQIMFCIEMEPDCVLQETQELVNFFVGDLIPVAQKRGVGRQKLLRYLGCCYDTCHQGVMGEDIGESLHAITQAGIQLGKIQISNAVKAVVSNTEQIQELTAVFSDKKFLHQTKVFKQGKLVQALPDLDYSSLNRVLENTDEQLEARIHYHIPVNQGASDLPLDCLNGTQEAILQTLDFLKKMPSQRPYLEIETYTWLNFLAAKTDKTQSLHNGFVAEFSWLEAQLKQRNLLVC